MCPLKRTSLLLIFILLTFCLTAQDNGCNIAKTFAVKQGSALNLYNKFGDINIVTVKDDSLSICAALTIVHDNPALISENIKFINVKIEKLNDTIYVSTSYDKKFFSDALRKGRQSFSVDYLIRLPEYLDIHVRNEFGNISIEELRGSFDARLSNGSLRARNLKRGNLKPLNSILIDHGSAEIGGINWLISTFVSCPSVKIDYAEAMTINSALSKITIGKINSLVSNSKSDTYNISSINNLFVSGTYSVYGIDKFTGGLTSKITFGALKISDLARGFRTIDITSDHSQIYLKPDKESSFKAEVTLSNGLLEFQSERYPGLLRKDKNTDSSLSGFAGNDKQSRSSVLIKAAYGKVTID